MWSPTSAGASLRAKDLLVQACRLEQMGGVLAVGVIAAVVVEVAVADVVVVEETQIWRAMSVETAASLDIS
jgi:hypothetical protein